MGICGKTSCFHVILCKSIDLCLQVYIMCSSSAHDELLNRITRYFSIFLKRWGTVVIAFQQNKLNNAGAKIETVLSAIPWFWKYFYHVKEHFFCLQLNEINSYLNHYQCYQCIWTGAAFRHSRKLLFFSVSKRMLHLRRHTGQSHIEIRILNLLKKCFSL